LILEETRVIPGDFFEGRLPQFPLEVLLSKDLLLQLLLLLLELDGREQFFLALPFLLPRLVLIESLLEVVLGSLVECLSDLMSDAEHNQVLLADGGLTPEDLEVVRLLEGRKHLLLVLLVTEDHLLSVLAVVICYIPIHPLPPLWLNHLVIHVQELVVDVTGLAVLEMVLHIVF